MAASNRAFPNVKCLLYSNSQTPFPVSPALVIDDVLLGTLVPNKGEAMVFQPEVDANPTISGEWYAQASFDDNPEGLTFVRFKADGTVVFGAKAIEGGGSNDMAGWILQPRTAYLDAKIGEKGEAMGNPKRADLKFEATNGVWETVISLNRKLLGTGLYNTNRRPPKPPTTPPDPNAPPVPEVPLDPNLNVVSEWEAVSKGDIPKNRSLCFNVGLLGRGVDNEDSQRSTVFVQWGNDGDGGKYRLVWEEGQSIGLDKWMYPIDPETKEPDYSKQVGFQRVKSFDGIENTEFKLQYFVVQIMRVAGRMLIGINSKWFWYLETEVLPSRTRKDGNEKVTPVDVNWGKGRIYLNVINARVRFEFGVIKYSNPEGKANEGSFTRRLKRYDSVNVSGIRVAKGGWEKEGTNIYIDMDSLPHLGKFTYKCTLEANGDGIDTPFLSKLLLYKDTSYTKPRAQSIPIESAINSIKISHSIPSRENSTGSTATVEVDMMRLDKIMNAPLNKLDFATSYRLIEIMGCWGDSFGQSDAAYAPLFRGYVTSFNDDLSSFASHTRTLRCRDMNCLLQAPAAFIDHRYAPLDIFFVAKAYGALSGLNKFPNSDNAVLYGWEMVREILRVERGELADKLQVIVPKGHGPLLSTDSDRCGYVTLKDALSGKQAPSNNGFMFPPPYKSSAYDWIKTITELDSAVFCMSYPKNNRSAWPVPTYAQRTYWFRLLDQAVPAWVAPDNLYPNQVWDHLVESMSIESRADRDYNHFFAASTGGENKDLGGMMPGVRMSEMYLQTGSNIAINSWRRTLDIQNDMAWADMDGSSGVDMLTVGTWVQLEGVDLLWPQVTIPGEPYMTPGDRVKIYREVGLKTEGPLKDSFSAAAGRDGFAQVMTRIQNLEHEINLNGGGNARRWTTKLDLTPLVNTL